MKPSTLKNLIRRYQNDTASPAERYIVERWLESFQQEKKPLPDADDEHCLQALQQRVLDKAFAERTAPAKRLARPWRGWAAAALVLCAVSLSLLLYVRRSGEENQPTQPTAAQTFSTGVKQVKQLLLPDSTMVYLNANTALEVTPDYGKGERVVKLEGEAYFEVKRDTLRPFRVQTDDLEIKVLGTAFNVNAYRMLDDVRVAVSSGKVEVSHGPRILALLHAKDRLTYDRLTAGFRQAHDESTHELSWREGTTVLERANFATLSQALYNYYGVQLQSPDKHVRASAYTFTVRSTRTLEQTMEQLCEMLKKEYRKEGNQVTIY